MMKYLAKIILRQGKTIRTFVFRIEKWVRDDLYSQVSQLKLQKLINLLTHDLLVENTLLRRGSSHDGGYVIVDLQAKYSHLLSFGVGDNVDFEAAMSEYVQSIEMYDPTVVQPPKNISNSTFKRIGLGPHTNELFISLEDATKKFVHSNDMILKIDIEGGEWESLRNVPELTLNSFVQVLIEFHNLHDIYNPEILDRYIEVLSALRRSHALVNVHANNWSPYSVIGGFPLPDTIEVTYVRRDSCKVMDGTDYNEIDLVNSPNNPEKPEYRLIF